MSSTSPASVSALEAHLGYWLRFVSNHVSHGFKTKVESLGVTVAEWVVLRALFEKDGIKPSELSAKIGLTRGAVSKLLKRLESKNLVVLRNDIRDGRSQLLTLHASGRRLVPKLAAVADQHDAQAFGHLKEDERAFLLAILKDLVERFEIREVPTD